MNISEVLLPMKKESYFSENIFSRKEESLVNQMLGSLSEDGANLAGDSHGREPGHRWQGTLLHLMVVGG